MSKRNVSYDFVIEHVKIGMMRSSALDAVMRRPSEFDGIDEYLYVSDGNYSGKIPADYPHNVWEYAERNTKAVTKIVGISEMLYGFPMKDDFLYVLTNTDGFYGAGNIIDKEAIRKKGIGNRLYAIPSSIHEWILAPFFSAVTAEDLGKLVREVNGEHVTPEEQLADRVYILGV